MAKKSTRRAAARAAQATSANRRVGGRSTGRAGVTNGMSTPAKIGLLIAAVAVVVVVVLASDWIFGSLLGGGSANVPSPSSGVTASPATSHLGVVERGNGGSWTDVTANELAGMLQHKNFTLINVRTTDSAIPQTDLFISYDQLTAQASKLPGDKGAMILVYCRTGVTSKIATQTLLGMGYTNVWMLTGGMQAWTDSGRSLVTP